MIEKEPLSSTDPPAAEPKAPSVEKKAIKPKSVASTPTKKKAPAASVKAASNGKAVSTAKTASARKPTVKRAAPKKAVAAPQAEDPINRAEDVLDDFGRKFGSFLSVAAKSFRRTAAVAKEEFEDLWAEAQSIRRGDTK